MRRLLRRLTGSRRKSTPTCYFETTFYHFDPLLWERRPPLYIDGYWQSTKYFADIRHRLQTEIVVQTDMSPGTVRLRESIRATESVCVHVRRGDYSNSIFRLMGPAYYRTAGAIVREHVTKPVFYIFSNDSEWARKNIELPGDTVTVAENSNGSFIDDFYLMRACRHFIIANSTFGWWPAWLAAHPDKVVVAPERWLKREDWPTPELREPDWHLL